MMTNKLVLDIAEHLTDSIERLCPVVLNRMSKGIQNIRGTSYRIHAVYLSPDHIGLKVSAVEAHYPGENMLLDDVALMSVPERARLLADLFEIAS